MNFSQSVSGASEGDFHEACNFAAVFAAPVVFLVQNNKYAISVPLARQSVAPSLAAKAVGYGMPGVRVDGNDVLACFAVMTEAAARARAGDAAAQGVPAGVGLVNNDHSPGVVAVGIGVSKSRAAHQSQRSNTGQYITDHASSP